MRIPYQTEQIINALGEQIKELIETGADQETVNQLGVQIYEKLVAGYRPFVKMAPPIVEAVGKDVTPVITALMKFRRAVAEDNEFESERAAWAKLRAKTRRLEMLAYTDEGFNPDQAFALVLQDAASSNPLASLLGALAKSANKKE